MKRTNNTPFWALAGCLAALSLAPAASAKADAGLACSSLLASIADGSNPTSQLAVVKSEKLYRWQARPWARLPEGVALYVRAPAGTTAADLHNAAAKCTRAGDEQSPLCVKGASVRVSRAGGVYILRITSDSRAAALEIQKRAERL
jgi:hypothetical protein